MIMRVGVVCWRRKNVYVSPLLVGRKMKSTERALWLCHGELWVSYIDYGSVYLTHILLQN
jgi:hypothetical protein